MLLAIDAVPPAGYRVTVAILNPLGQPNVQGQTAGGTPEIIRSATGASPTAAIAKIRATSYLNLDFRHLKGVVVSKAVAQRGLAAPLESVMRSPTLILTPWLYVASSGSAHDLLKSSATMMPNAGEVLQKTSEWSRALTSNYTERVFNFLEQMQVPGDDAVTGVVTLDPQQSQPDTLAFGLSGVAMFSSDRFVGWLHGPAALGWLVATGRADKQTVVAAGPDGHTLTLQLVSARHKVVVTDTASGPKAEIAVKVNARISAIQPRGLVFWQNPAAVQSVQDSAAGVLTADVRQALRSAQAAGSDIFALGQEVRVQRPSDWRKMAATWDTTGFRHLPVSVRVNVAVTSVGQIVCPAFGPC